MKISQPIAGLCLAALLSACGGGGGGDAVPSTSANVTFPIGIAIANYVNERNSFPFSMSGTAFSSDQTFQFTGSGTLSESTTAATFEGMPALKKNLSTTGTLALLGNTVPVSDTNAIFFDSNYDPLGSSGANNYCVATNKTSLPKTAKIGDNGSWYTSTCYTSSAKLSRIGGATVTYTLEPEGATSALFKVITRAVDISGTSSPTSLTFRITTSGALTRLEESGLLSASGVTLNYVGKYQ